MEEADACLLPIPLDVLQGKVEDYKGVEEQQNGIRHSTSSSNLRL
jgi:hypothetical protein